VCVRGSSEFLPFVGEIKVILDDDARCGDTRRDTLIPPAICGSGVLFVHLSWIVI